MLHFYFYGAENIYNMVCKALVGNIYQHYLSLYYFLINPLLRHKITARGDVSNQNSPKLKDINSQYTMVWVNTRS